MQRAVPACVAGKLLSYDNDPDAGSFTCTWQEEPAITAPTEVYVPSRLDVANRAITLTPEGAGYATEPAIEGSENVYFVIPPMGEAVERMLTIK
ncbi:MAG: hypothetical protein R6V12_19315 [Candidatus Hydrogenedentota bacterium]